MMRVVATVQARMALRWLAAIGLACVIAGSAMGTAESDDRPDRFSLLRDLRDGAYEALDAELSTWQMAFESNTRAEAGVVAAFRSFASSDTTLERPLQEWVERRPPSFAAHVARGVYYRHLAALSRGSQVFEKVPHQRLTEMERYDLLATADFEAAIALRPRAVAAHAWLILIATDHGDTSLLERRVNDAVSALGPTLAVCTAYMGRFDARRGGSMTDVASFIGTTRYGPLCGSLAAEGRYFVEMAAGAEARDAHDIISAIDHFSVAASLGDDRAPRFARGLIFYYNGWHRGAVAEFDRLIAVDPDDADALFWRGMSKWRLRNADDALADIDAAVALDPSHPDFLALRGELLVEQDRPSEAAADLEHARTFGEYDEQVQATRGRLLMTRLADPAGAAGAYERLVQLAPETSRYWMEYALLLVQLRDCRATEAAARFRSMCPRQGSCPVTLDDKFYSETLEWLRLEQRCQSPN